MYKTTQEFNILFFKIPLGTTHRKTVPQKMRDLQVLFTAAEKDCSHATLPEILLLIPKKTIM